MRILIKEKEDGTLRCVEIVSSCYDPEELDMYFDIASSNACEDDTVGIIVRDIYDAERITRTLAKEGYCDLTAYDAYIDEIPVKEEIPDPTTTSNRRSLFR